MGFTTDEAIDMLDDAMFTRNFAGLFIAQDLDTAKDIFSNKIDYAWRNVLPDLQKLYLLNNDSARQMKFDFGDGSESSITVDSSGRSGTYNRLHITEFAQVCRKFPDKAKEVLEGSIPAVPLGGRVDIESTADGSEGRFYEIFWEAWERGQPRHETEFKAFFFNWTYDDSEIAKVEIRRDLPKDMRDYQNLHKLTDLQISYYYTKWLSLNKDWAAMKKEYPTTVFEAFEGSGNKLFDSSMVGLMPQETGKKIGDWLYYSEPELGHSYAIGADVAEGVGQDSSTATIWDFTPIKPRIVAEYKSNRIAPDLFSYELKNGGEKYQMALIAVERNNHGHTTLSKLKEIYSPRSIYKDEKDKYGWDTNLVTKPKMFYDLSTAVNNELVDIPSPHIQSEMRRYDKEELNSARFNPESTQHWDLLTATAIGFQMKNSRTTSEPRVARQWKPTVHRNT